MKNRTFYDRISGAYDLLADSSERACRESGLAALQLRPGERGLEVGFGTGHALVAMAEAVGRGGQIVGVDASTGMLAVTKPRVAAYRNVALITGDAWHLSLREASFDAAFMSFTLELFEPADISRVLREVKSVLRPCGRVGIVSMAARAHDNTATRAYKWMHRHFPHFVDCRPIDVLADVRAAGFQNVAFESMSIWGLEVMAVTAQRPFGRLAENPGAD